ncbi:MAG: ATP-binding protein [Desulfamplus sp.]
MKEMISIPADEFERLKNRNKKLAKEKASLQFYVNLINQMSSAPGLDNTIEMMLKHILNIMGGTNLILYYIIDDKIFYADVYGRKMKIDKIDDELVSKAFETGMALESDNAYIDSMMLNNINLTDANCFVFPLMVGKELIGVFKIESLRLVVLQLHEELPSFFNFVALILKNEIIGHTRLKKANDQLRQINEELESFSYSVSHDLRAPLRSIDGWTLALAEDFEDIIGEDGRKYIHRIRSETQRMSQLIDDILNLSRLTRVQMNLSVVNISAIAEQVVLRLKELDVKSNVEYVIEPDLTVYADAGMIDIVLTNLIGNAFKFTDKTALPRVEFGKIKNQLSDSEQFLTKALNSDKQIFYIKDNGAGFEMQYAKKLFSPFQRLHKSTEFPGTGIGLATVKRIIHRLGGSVWAEGKIDQGATFYFTL